LSIFDCPFGFLWIVHSWLAPLVFSGLSIHDWLRWFSLDCPFMIGSVV
jgi:hypothetical protein